MGRNIMSLRKGMDKPVKGLNEGRKSTGDNDYGQHSSDQKTTASNPALSKKYGGFSKQGQGYKIESESKY